MDKTAFEQQFVATLAGARDMFIKQAAPSAFSYLTGKAAKKADQEAVTAWHALNSARNSARLSVEHGSAVKNEAYAALEDVQKSYKKISDHAYQVERDTNAFTSGAKFGGATGIVAGAGLGAGALHLMHKQSSEHDALFKQAIGPVQYPFGMRSGPSFSEMIGHDLGKTVNGSKGAKVGATIGRILSTAPKLS